MRKHKTFKRVLSLLLCVIMVFGSAPLAGLVGIELPSITDLFTKKAEAATSGTCGDNLTWSFDESTGTLTISGTGAMTNYSYSSATPWYDYQDMIEKVVIGNDVTSVGNSAFEYCDFLSDVTIGSRVTSIGVKAFYSCDNLKSIIIPDSVTSIGERAFEYCDSLASVNIGSGVTSINGLGSYFSNAFSSCTSLESITISEDNNNYSSDNYGVLFNKDKSELLQYPIGNLRTSYSIPNSVTSIGENAFDDCKYLKNITIENGLKSIGKESFYGCDSLESITIPDSVISISNNAFRSCDKLSSITVSENNNYYSSDNYGVLFNKDKSELLQYPIGNLRTSYSIPNSVTSIGYDTFYSCKSLESIIIPDSVTSIGDYAFQYCNSLASVNIGNSVASIGDDAFYSCTSLESITIPDSVTSIGDYAFQYCNSLASVNIGNGVTSIGSAAFGYCDKLSRITVSESNNNYSSDTYGVLFNKDKTELKKYPCGNSRTSYTVPNSVASIGNSAFSRCTSLESITIPDSVTSIGDYAFFSCTSLESVTIGNGVTSMGNSAFSRCTSLESVTIGNAVTSIGDWAFSDCTSLESITIPDSVTSIGDRAFTGCSNVKSITIGSGITDLSWLPSSVYLKKITVDSDNQSYSNDEYGVLFNKDKTELIKYFSNDARTSYSIPNGVTIIDAGAFNGCTELTSVTIPGSVTSIGEDAFYRCTGLSSISISKNVTSIGENAFAHCINLEKIDVDASNADYLSIDGVVFSKDGKTLCAYPCGKEAEYEIPSGVIEIPVFAFAKAKTSKITIPESVTTIGCAAFAGCENLKQIDISAKIATIEDYCFVNCKNLESVTIPESVTTIGSAAFAGCENLKQIDLPDKIVTIEDYCFANCKNLESFIIPAGVKEIGAAFINCKSLKSIYIPSSVTKIAYMAFEGCSLLEKITVDSDNEYYSSDAYGAWYNKEKTALIKIPENLSAETFYIPDSVANIPLVSLEDIESPPFSGLTNCRGVQKFAVGSANKWFSSDEQGVLYNKDKTVIVQYPCGSKNKVYTLPSTIDPYKLYDDFWGDLSFTGSPALEKIKVDSQNKYFYNDDDGVLYCKVDDLFGIVKFPNNSPLAFYSVPEKANYSFACFSDALNLRCVHTSDSSDEDLLMAFWGKEYILDYICLLIISDIYYDEYDYLELLRSFASTDRGLVTLCSESKPSFLSDFEGYEDITAMYYGFKFKQCNGQHDDIIFACGDNLKWHFDEATGTLTISGTGNMYDYNADNRPWEKYEDLIKKIVINDGATSIGKYAFYHCDNLTDVIIPDSVTSIGDYAFANCGILKNAKIPNTITSMGNNVFDSSGITEITVTGKVEENTFKDCNTLTKVTIADGVTIIGEGAFRGCNALETIYIPNSVKTICDWAFYGCTSLTDVYYDGTKEEWGKISIGEHNECLTNATIHFKDGTTSKDAVLDKIEIKSMPVKTTYKVGETLNITGLVITVTYSNNTAKEITSGFTCTPETLSTEGNQTITVTYEGKTVEFSVTVENNTSSHTHTPKTVKISATCTTPGMEYEICSECGEPLGESRNIPALGHTEVIDRAVPATCTKTGLTEGIHCSVCDEIIKEQTIVPLADHTPGDWVVDKEPTAEAEGKKVKRCTVCGETLEEEILPKLKIVTDSSSGISIDYTNDTHEGNITLNVEETFDGAAFNVVNTQLEAARSMIYDIKMMVDGVETQPTGTVTVKIPLPSGYNPKYTFVYHVNSETNKVEPMHAQHKDGYLVFETDHFSYYAVVEIVKITIATPSTRTINYGDSIILHANAENLPSGAKIVWETSNGNFGYSVSTDGTTCTITPKTSGDTVFTAKIVDKDGNVISSATQKMTSKAGLWQKIVAFFKNLFGKNQVIPYIAKSLLG